MLNELHMYTAAFLLGRWLVDFAGAMKAIDEYNPVTKQRTLQRLEFSLKMLDWEKAFKMNLDNFCEECFFMYS